MAEGCFKTLPTDDTDADIASEGVEAALIPKHNKQECTIIIEHFVTTINLETTIGFQPDIEKAYNRIFTI